MLTLTRPEGAPASDFHLTRRGVAAAFFSGYAAAGLWANADPIHTDEAGLIVSPVSFPSAGFSLPGFLARPDAKGRFPTILVVSEVFGIHEYIKDVCRRLAKLGYVALAPAFFVRVGDPAPLTDMSAVIKIVAQASDQQVLGDVGAAVKFLKAQPFVDRSRLAVTGFCWGGGGDLAGLRDLRGLQGRGSLVRSHGCPTEPSARPEEAVAGGVGRQAPRSGPGPLWRSGPTRRERAGHARGPGRGAPVEQRDHRVPRRRPWLSRRLSGQLQRRRCSGRLAANARLLLEKRRWAQALHRLTCKRGRAP